jgi:hypothetical protein
LDIWCSKRINNPRHGAEADRLPGAGEAGQEMPLTNADILAHCAKRGLPVAEVLCRRVNGLDCPNGTGTPHYDATRRVLSLQGVKLLQFDRGPGNQIAILEALQDAGWPDRIENPLGPHRVWDAKHDVSDAVGELNERQNRIHFWVERGTRAVHWALIDDDSGCQP